MGTKKKEAPHPPWVKREDRTCFGIAYFASEADASAYHDYVRSKGLTYNGGMFHGMACGRDRGFDRDGLFAVTD